MKTRMLYPVMLFAALAGFTSCSKDDDTVLTPEQEQALSTEQAQNFFNLKTGSEWTYKRYENSEASPETFTFSGDTDRVTVESTVEANGLTYSKLKHTITNPADSETFVRYEYSRVDNSGHLVSIFRDSADESFLSTVNENSAVLVHPGVDAAYASSVNNSFGKIDYKLGTKTTLTVEGNSYNVLPYNGVFTPNKQGLVAKTIATYYAPNIGMVKSSFKELNSTYAYEDRLVSYHLAQ